MTRTDRENHKRFHLFSHQGNFFHLQSQKVQDDLSVVHDCKCFLTWREGTFLTILCCTRRTQGEVCVFVEVIVSPTIFIIVASLGLGRKTAEDGRRVEVFHQIQVLRTFEHWKCRCRRSQNSSQVLSGVRRILSHRIPVDGHVEDEHRLIQRHDRLWFSWLEDRGELSFLQEINSFAFLWIWS